MDTKETRSPEVPSPADHCADQRSTPPGLRTQSLRDVTGQAKSGASAATPTEHLLELEQLSTRQLVYLLGGLSHELCRRALTQLELDGRAESSHLMRANVACIEARAALKKLRALELEAEFALEVDPSTYERPSYRAPNPFPAVPVSTAAMGAAGEAAASLTPSEAPAGDTTTTGTAGELPVPTKSADGRAFLGVFFCEHDADVPCWACGCPHGGVR